MFFISELKIDTKKITFLFPYCVVQLSEYSFYPASSSCTSGRGTKMASSCFWFSSWFKSGGISHQSLCTVASE